MPLPDVVLLLARSQRGLLTRSQLLERGVRPGQLNGWRQTGILEDVQRSVYRLAGAPRSWEQDVLAAVLRCGADARAGGAPSCALLGLEGFPRAGSPEVVVPAPARPRAVGFAVRSRILLSGDAAVVDGIPALGAPRALIEVAPHLSDKGLRLAIDSARRRGYLSIPRLLRKAEALDGHRGAGRILRLCRSGALEQESEGERVLARFLAPLGLQLEWQVTDLVPGRRLDAAERALRLGFEYDGRDHHVLPTDRDADGIRDLECMAAGVQVIRITAGMIRETPTQTLAWIAAVRLRRQVAVTGGRLR